MTTSHNTSKDRSNTAIRPPMTGQGVLHQLFEAQTARTPDAIALTFENDRLSYGELNRRANQLAHHLRNLGVGPDVLVALCLERSIEMVIGILAVLKAGGAYLPIDLAYPKERLAFMLNDAKATVLVTQKTLADRVPIQADGDASGIRVIWMDQDSPEIAKCADTNLDTGVEPPNLAYVIYTSGSTGKPKGVQVTHQNVVRLFTATDHWFAFGPQDVWTMFHSYAFDFSVWELWGALLYGGRLVVVPYLTSRTPSAFYDLLAREQVTVLNQTPSAFRQLIWTEESAAQRHALNLRFIVFGGEALELQSLKPWFDRHGDRQPLLVNMYGITETTVHVTYRPITLADLASGQGSVIGVPIPDLQVHILDPDGQPVPAGQAGEMYVGGTGLARGYLNRPELTAQRFVPDRFSKVPGARLYKTGDVARLLPNGDLEYLGRCDDQVKIRGFRIELGEIESVLNRHPGVRESVVIADSEQVGGDKRLIAYIVRADEKTAVGNLRDHLKTQVPEYMVPALMIFVDSIPLTPNGKVDRRALPKPGHARPESMTAYAAPRTEAEKTLAAIWEEVLEVRPVGIHDNFFELGGDSIRVLQVLSRSARAGISITLAQVFQEQTIANVVSKLNLSATGLPGVAKVEPFSLVPEADRSRLPDGLEDAYPTISLQAGMRYHNELNPKSAIFHDVFSFKIEAPFQREQLEQAIDLLAGRHPCLRTSFEFAAYSAPLQLVHRKVRVPLSVEDLSRLAPEQQVEALKGWVDTEKYRPFDWSTAPLLRFHMQVQNERTFQIITSFHHAIMDGWSLAALLTELFQDYFSLLKGSPASLPRPQVLYRTYVHLERQAIASDEHRQFWTKQLQGATAQTLPRWPKAMRAGGSQQERGPEIMVNDAVFAGLKRLVQTTGAPLRSVLLAAHQRVMAFLNGQPDVITGLVTNGRPEEADAERMIGLFLNTIPIRQQLDGGTWADLVRATFAAERALIPYRRFPLIEVQRVAQNNALFETAFDYVHFHVYRNLEGYKGVGFTEGHYFEANNFTLYTTFMLDITSTQLQFHFDYNPEEICREQAEVFCEYYSNTLAAMAFDANGRYEEFSPIAASERRKLLREWNATEREYPRESCVHDLIAQQARRTPEAVAVECSGRRLTYAQLDQRADALAAHLRSLGVGPDALVGLLMERSVEMLVALLGILKAGGAYIPLDPTYPKDRLKFMIQDARPRVLLTQASLRGLLPDSGTQVVLFEETPVTSSAGSNDRRASAGDLAYVIYTSGSTGKPKGVQIPHRALTNFLCAMKTEPGMSAQDILLSVTTLSFDIAGLELYLPLICGGRVVIATRDEAADSDLLAKTIESSGATMMQATPATWRMLIQMGWKGNLALKALCGGEALSPDLAGELLSRCGSLWNMYGPTETTIWSALCEVKQGDAIVLGRPIANTQCYVLDARMQPVPVGVAGELFIGGDGLARGYLNRPELTAEKFVDHPLNGQGKLYRTSDLARYLPDGSLEYLGRMDHQVKIRGFRIELGEIQAALAKHPLVAEAVVVALEETPGNSRLVAYLRPCGSAPKMEELRSHLVKTLPEYMAPSAFVILDAFPLTPNGKIDRKALPKPDCARPELEKQYVAPRNAAEKTLANLWSEVLRIDRIGIHDNFFALGGHSLLATQVITRIRSEFRKEVPLQKLFEAPTVADLCAAIEQVKDGNGHSATPELKRLARTPSHTSADARSS